MKKVFYATLALGALILASCQKENSVNGPKVESPVFTAYIDTDAPAGQPETKTVLVETAEGKKSEWVSGDAIRVLNGTNIEGCDAVYTTTDEGASATFTTANKGFKGTEFVAMYPAEPNTSAWWNKNYPEYVNKLKLDPEQTATEGSYDPKAHIAVAYSKNTSLAFQNAVSLLKFTVASDNVSEVCIYPNTSTDYVAGNFSIAVTGDNVGTISKDGGDDTGWKNYNYVKATGSFEKGKTYYIACLPTTFTTGFTVEVVSKGIKGDNKTTEKNYELKRNTILDLGTVEYVAPTMQTVYLYPGPWTSDKAVLSVYFWGAGEGWADFSDADGDGRYEAQIPIGVAKCHYIRSNPKNPHNWDGVWNRYDNLVLSQKNCITVSSDSSGNWNYSTSKVE